MPPPQLDLADLVRRSQAMAKASTGQPAGLADPAADRLQDVAEFGPNPGALRMRVFLPDPLPPKAPLLVVLHGCTQTAAGFDQGCGWSDLAGRLGFALLMPEQRQANNQNRCFNWFEPHDASRGHGEAESIHAMVGWMLRTHALDPARVFIAGLSAGGAMTTVMLATYPEVFAAGAVIGGLPYGAAANVQEAFEAMATGRPRPAHVWAALVRAAAGQGRNGIAAWPRIAIWQGEADTTVRTANARELAKQWTSLHGVDLAPSQLEAEANGVSHQVWHDSAGRAVVELNRVPGLGHGVPIDPGPGPGQSGRPMPFILEAKVPAPWRILDFFGLTGAPATEARQPLERPGRPLRTMPLAGVAAVGQDGAPRRDAARQAGTPGPRGVGPDKVEPARGIRGGRLDAGGIIRRALAAAGLIKRR